MNHSIADYKPLTEAVTYSGDTYYKSCSVEEFAQMQTQAETLYFDVSKTYVKSAHVKEWREADPDDVLIAWETANLTKREKTILQT